MKYLQIVFELIREAAQKWSDDKASIFAAALAYYTIFSLAPILVLAVAIASRVLQQTNVQEMILNLAAENLGQGVADFLAELLPSMVLNSSSVPATIISLGILIWGATGVFNHLKRALNAIWGVEPHPQTGFGGIIYFAKTRLSAFILVLGIGFLLIVMVLANTIISILNGLLDDYVPQVAAITQSGMTTFLIMLLLSTMLFAIIFRTLPDARVAWRDVWLGALVTAVLFTTGNFLISIYLRYSSPASAYGAAGSLVVALLYIYYSAQIFFFGAEFTQVYANRYGSKVRPAGNAVAVRRQRIEDLPPPPEPPMPLIVCQTPPGDSPLRQRAKQAGFGLLGLAAGLFVGFIASLRRER
ncbi:MAG: YihY/virulence factor BrkB family protein [Chloroflexi bacterium]|nr:YihY/virulence factor BrkB family protein [Chloroflexota bacterium]